MAAINSPHRYKNYYRLSSVSGRADLNEYLYCVEYSDCEARGSVEEFAEGRQCNPLA